MTYKIKHIKGGETVAQLHSFVSVLRKTGYVGIPVDIRKHLCLKPGDILEVGVRKLARDEAYREYGHEWNSRGLHGIDYGDVNIVVCPVCGKKGRLTITEVSNKYGRSHFQITVAHIDNVFGRVAHYITNDYITTEIRVAIERMKVIREEFLRSDK